MSGRTLKSMSSAVEALGQDPSSAGDRHRRRRVAVVTDEASLGAAAIAALARTSAAAPDLRQQTEMRIRHCAAPAASVNVRSVGSAEEIAALGVPVLVDAAQSAGSKRNGARARGRSGMRRRPHHARHGRPGTRPDLGRSSATSQPGPSRDHGRHRLSCGPPRSRTPGPRRPRASPARGGGHRSAIRAPGARLADQRQRRLTNHARWPAGWDARLE